MATNNFTLTTDALATEGQQIHIKMIRTTSDTLSLTVTYPTGLQITEGVLILLSDRQMNPSNRPTDTVVYESTNDLANPADTIGSNAEAYVVGAFYDNDSLPPSPIVIDIENVDPSKVYFASVHAISGVRQYFSAGSLSYALNISQSSSTASGDIPSTSVVPTNPSIGQVYYNPDNNTVSMWSGAIWMPAGVGTVATGSVYPDPLPVVGTFFYNTVTRSLEIYTGLSGAAAWSKANTANQGVPMYQKPGIGTDGTLDERADLINTLKHMLGWPTVCVELKEDNFNVAIDDALGEFRHRADNAYHKAYLLFSLRKGQQTYYLNDPVIGTNKSVDIIKIWRLGAMSGHTSNDSGVYDQVFLNQIGMNTRGSFDLTSIHLMANLSEEIQRLFAGDLTFTWHESARVLNLQKRILRDEAVILETSMERTEQDLITDRWTKSWIKNWAYAKCLEQLGMIRSKFGSLPGAGGGISLNGSELLSRSDQKFEELKQQIDNFEVGNNSPEFAHPLLIG